MNPSRTLSIGAAVPPLLDRLGALSWSFPSPAGAGWRVRRGPLKYPGRGAALPPSSEYRGGGCAGVTIAEVAMAVVVLALVITTSLTAMQRAFLSLDTARNLEIAGNIMQCEIEKERLLGWAQVSDAAYQPVLDASFARNPAIAGRFTLSRSLASLPQRSGQMVQITLTVRWRSYDGRRISRSYTTYYGQGGLYSYFRGKP